MTPSKKRKIGKILEGLTESQKSHLFVSSGIDFAIYNGASRDSIKDMVETGLELHRAVVIGELINIFAEVLTPNGAPPSTSKLIDAFNMVVASAGEIRETIKTEHDRFILMVETLSTKGGKA